MDWPAVLRAKVQDVEKEEALLEDLYTFFSNENLPHTTEDAPPELLDQNSLLRVVQVLRTVMKMKGLEVMAAEEEVRELQDQCDSLAARVGGSTTEKDLVEQVVRLEKELRFKDDMMERLKDEQAVRSVSPSKMLELRHLRDELDDTKMEREDLKRSLLQEQEENRKLLDRETGERLRSRQLERELEAVRHNLEENAKTLEWHRGQERMKGKEADFRERMRKKMSEMESLEAMVQELLRKRNELEEGMQQMLEELVEERELKLAAINEKAAMEKALVQSDAHCDELEAQNNLLTEQIQDHQLQLSKKAAENEEAYSILSRKAPEWEHALEVKDKELSRCREKIHQLESQLQGSQGHVNLTTLKGLKKELEKREAELGAVQKELGEATQHISDLAAELVQVRGRGDPGMVKSAMKQELERAQAKVAILEKDLALEVHRREEAESENEGRDEKMTLALGKLGEYERGDYGLREAVMEIKVKKKELALRDKDIAELTQHVNLLENELNRFSEENEALRDRLGIGESEEVDVSQVREKRREQLLQLQKDSRMLEKEVERLQEENVSLRRKNLEYALVRATPTPPHVDSVTVGSRAHDPPGSRHRHDGSSGNALPEGAIRSKVMSLEKACEEERRSREMWQAKAEEAKEKLKQNQFRLRSVEAVLKEMQGEESGEVEQKKPFTQESLDRLLTLLESEGGLSSVHFKSKLSELTGQNEVLTQQLHRAEHDTKAALRELERKQCEVEALNRDVTILRKQVAGFRPIPLPEGLPLSSSEVITSLNEQLLHNLQQLHEREDELRTVRGTVDGLQRKFAVIMHQLGVLYQEHVEKCGQWEEHVKVVEVEKQKLLEERGHDKIKVQELEGLQAALAGGEEGMKKHLGEMSRRVTVLQVKEQVTGRKAQLLQEREAALRKENAVLCREKVQIEKVITERIAFLQRHKETALYKLRSLQQELSRSVPCSELDKANVQYQQLAAKYQNLLNQQNAYTVTTANVEELKVEIRTLNDQLDEVKTELSVEKKKCRLLEVSSNAAGGHGKERDRGGARERGASADQITTLEMKALNATQRAELASVRYQQLQEVVMQLEQRNSTLETNFSELTRHLLQAQASEADLRDQLASALPQEHRAELEHRISDLSKSEAQLTIGNSQLKEVAEVARQQAAAVETMQKSRDLEVISLRHQLLDLQGGSDEKTALGRLHHQLLSCQVSEATAVKKLEVSEAKVIKMEAALLRSERERVRESESVFKVRAEANAKIKQLRSMIQSLRRQYAGCVPLSEHENFVLLLQRAQEDKREAEKLRKESKNDREEAKVKLLELVVQKKNLEELVAALQDLSSNPNSASASTRMIEWHSKLGELRLVEMRVTRANQRLRERTAQLEGLVGSGEEAFTKLEQQLMVVTKEYEEKQLLWEHREALLEKQLDTIKTSTAATSLDISSSVNHDSPRQLQDALIRLQECSREKNMLSQHLQAKEREVERLESALRQVKDEVVQKEDEMVLVRRETEKTRKINLLITAEKEEEERALKLAQDTTRHLKIQLSEKDEVAEKYQTMLQDARKQLQREVTAHKQEIAALRTRLHSQEDQNFTRLRTEALEVASSPAPPLPSDSQLERLLVLEDMTASQEEEIKRLRHQMETEEEESRARMKEYEAVVKSLQNEVKEKNKQHRTEMEDLRGSLSESRVRVDEVEQEVDILEGELSAAQEAAKKAPSRTLRALVERLRNQLSIKEKQQRALSEALLQVRADLVETAQRTLEGEDERAAQEESIRELVLHKTEELQEQMEELKQHLNEVEGECSASESREKEGLERIRKLSGEIRSKEREVREARLQLQEQAEALIRARTSEDQLTKRIQQLEKEPSVFVLQRRVKTLQEKVETQKSKIKELEGELQTRIAREQKLLSSQGQGQKSRDLSSASSGGTQTGDKSTMTMTAAQTGDPGRTPAEDRTHQAMQVLRWEEGKKWQKKMTSVRVKLEEKTRELEAAQKQIMGLKELQTRSDRERITLSSRVKALQKQLSEVQEKAEEAGGSGSHSVIELERVVNAMRKVIDKLQGENEKLKKKRTEAGPLSSTSKSSDKLLEENKKLKAELQELQKSTLATSSEYTSVSPYKPLVSENERLKRDLKAEMSRTEKLQHSLSNTQLHNQKLTQEVQLSHSSPSVSGEGRMRDTELMVKVEELQAELEKKTFMLMEVKRHLKEVAEKEKNTSLNNSKYTVLVKERDELKEETVKLRKELDAFDPAFFEEIEDLKFNYEEAVKKNVRLETQLNRLRTEHQIPLVQDGDS